MPGLRVCGVLKARKKSLHNERGSGTAVNPLTAKGSIMSRQSTSITAVAEVAKKFIDIFGPGIANPLNAAGDLIADYIKDWQWKNRVRICERTVKLIEERGIAKRVLPPDFVIPVLELAGNAGNENLQTAWSHLLAAAIENEQGEHIAFATVLSQMNATDARVLESMINLGYRHPKERALAIAEDIDVSVEIVRLSLSNAQRLGFFTPTQKRLRLFAISFLRICLVNSVALDSYLEEQNNIGRAAVID